MRGSSPARRVRAARSRRCASRRRCSAPQMRSPGVGAAGPARRRWPATGHRQIVVIEDADRLTEGAANALLKVVEEPPPSTVFLLCAPSVDPEDIAITLRSRCRHVALVTPTVDAIAQVLVQTDGLAEQEARWAASVSGGHVGRARRLATDPA